MLQDCLGGNCKTYLIATVSPSKSNTEETISTLKFADRAKQVMLLTSVNDQKVVDEAYVNKLLKQIGVLKWHLKRFMSEKEVEGIDYDAVLGENGSGGVAEDAEGGIEGGSGKVQPHHIGYIHPVASSHPMVAQYYDGTAQGKEVESLDMQALRLGYDQLQTQYQRAEAERLQLKEELVKLRQHTSSTNQTNKSNLDTTTPPVEWKPLADAMYTVVNTNNQIWSYFDQFNAYNKLYFSYQMEEEEYKNKCLHILEEWSRLRRDIPVPVTQFISNTSNNTNGMGIKMNTGNMNQKAMKRTDINEHIMKALPPQVMDLLQPVVNTISPNKAVLETSPKKSTLGGVGGGNINPTAAVVASVAVPAKSIKEMKLNELALLQQQLNNKGSINVQSPPPSITSLNSSSEFIMNNISNNGASNGTNLIRTMRSRSASPKVMSSSPKVTGNMNPNAVNYDSYSSAGNVTNNNSNADSSGNKQLSKKKKKTEDTSAISNNPVQSNQSVAPGATQVVTNIGSGGVNNNTKKQLHYNLKMLAGLSDSSSHKGTEDITKDSNTASTAPPTAAEASTSEEASFYPQLSLPPLYTSQSNHASKQSLLTKESVERRSYEAGADKDEVYSSLPPLKPSAPATQAPSTSNYSNNQSNALNTSINSNRILHKSTYASTEVPLNNSINGPATSTAATKDASVLYSLAYRVRDSKVAEQEHTWINPPAVEEYDEETLLEMEIKEARVSEYV